MKVYFIEDKNSDAVKIGKANDIKSRLSELQVGNPNELTLINQIECKTEEESFLVEDIFHNKYQNLHIRGEWFKYTDEFANSTIKLPFNVKQIRNDLSISTLLGEEVVVSVNTHPRCYFYSHLSAQIKSSYEESLNMKMPYRTMEYPTYGKQMLMPYSSEVNRVFISGRKHEENLELKRFKENKLRVSNLESIFS